MSKIWLTKLIAAMKMQNKKAKPLSLAAGLSETYIRDLIERGVEPTLAKLEAIANQLGLPMSYFFDEESTPPQIAIKGYASGGDRWTPVDDYQDGDGIAHIDLDIANPDLIGVRVRGPSMSPVFRDGDDLICFPQHGLDISSAVGKDCVVETANQERYIKQVLKGSKKNTYRLRSYNTEFPDIEDVALAWAAPVLWIRRSSRT